MKKFIHSADNPQFKQLKKLATSSRERRKLGRCILDGTHLIQAYSEHNQSNETIIIIVRQDKETHSEINACINLFQNAECILLSNELFDVLSPVETPTGILAVIDRPIPQKDTGKQASIALDNIQDPGNLGTILRTAAAAGISNAYLSKGCVDAWSPKVLRAAMGAHFVINIHEHYVLTQLQQQFQQIIATQLDAKTSIFNLDFKDNCVFLFGNEGAGLSPELSACATHHVNIPMSDNIESLNVAAAVAVCLFERYRKIKP